MSCRNDHTQRCPSPRFNRDLPDFLPKKCTSPIFSRFHRLLLSFTVFIDRSHWQKKINISDNFGNEISFWRIVCTTDRPFYRLNRGLTGFLPQKCILPILCFGFIDFFFYCSHCAVTRLYFWSVKEKRQISYRFPLCAEKNRKLVQVTIINERLKFND